jgi:hypothetical protein
MAEDDDAGEGIARADEARNHFPAVGRELAQLQMTDDHEIERRRRLAFGGKDLARFQHPRHRGSENLAARHVGQAGEHAVANGIHADSLARPSGHARR